jgi:hypothetical protein
MNSQNFLGDVRTRVILLKNNALHPAVKRIVIQSNVRSFRAIRDEHQGNRLSLVHYTLRSISSASLLLLIRYNSDPLAFLSSYGH